MVLFERTDFLRIGVAEMTDTQRTQIKELRLAGYGYKKIAQALCLSVDTVKSYCGHSGLEENLLKSISADVLGIDEFDEAAFTDKVDHITVVSNEELIFHLKDGSEVTRQWQFKRRQPAWSEERKQRQSKKMKQVWRDKHEQSENS